MGFNYLASGFGQNDFTNLGSGTINTTGSNLIIVGLSGVLGDTFSDTRGNTWTPLTTYDTGSDPGITLYYCYNPSTDISHNFTSTTGKDSYITAVCFSGSASSPFDTESGYSSNYTLSIQPGSITPSGNGALVICALGIGYDADYVTLITSGMTLLNVLDWSTQPGMSNQSYGGAIAYIIQGSAFSMDPQYDWTDTITGAGGTPGVIACASFLPASYSPSTNTGNGFFRFQR